MTDICITWPKARPLDSYLNELVIANQNQQTINYRVPSCPTRLLFGDLCFTVHDGYVRGYTMVVGVTHYSDDIVQRVASDSLQGFWPSGWYIVRVPKWHELIEPVERKGFQGYRYVTLEEKTDYLKAYCGESDSKEPAQGGL